MCQMWSQTNNYFCQRIFDNKFNQSKVFEMRKVWEMESGEVVGGEVNLGWILTIISSLSKIVLIINLSKKEKI